MDFPLEEIKEEDPLDETTKSQRIEDSLVNIQILESKLKSFRQTLQEHWTFILQYCPYEVAHSCYEKLVKGFVDNND